MLVRSGMPGGARRGRAEQGTQRSVNLRQTDKTCTSGEAGAFDSSCSSGKKIPTEASSKLVQFHRAAQFRCPSPIGQPTMLHSRPGVLASTITPRNGEKTCMTIDHELCRARLTETQYCRSGSSTTPSTAPSRASSSPDAHREAATSNTSVRTVDAGSFANGPGISPREG